MMVFETTASQTSNDNNTSINNNARTVSSKTNVPQLDQQQQQQQQEASLQLQVSYHGQKFDITIDTNNQLTVMTTYDLKKEIIRQYYEHTNEFDHQVVIEPSELKLVYKGKVMQNDNELIMNIIGQPSTKGTSKNTKSVIHKIVAVGVSVTKVQQLEQEIVVGMNQNRINVRDDLSTKGQLDLKKRRILGKQLINKSNIRQSGPVYKFGAIETIPGLPNEATARQILTTLANDPGVLACLAKHQWNVGTLAELYPEGKVGQSPVCVMGYNTNHGQVIKLRLRTDDLNGFRKILSIKQVLYHELAHNVFSEHDDNFFQLMRQIEKECTEYDWTNGAGVSSGYDNDNESSEQLYTAGTYRLGGAASDSTTTTTAALITREQRRELLAQAAERRYMTPEEEYEIEMNCGCNTLAKDLFLPSSSSSPKKEDDDKQQ